MWVGWGTIVWSVVKFRLQFNNFRAVLCSPKRHAIPDLHTHTHTHTHTHNIHTHTHTIHTVTLTHTHAHTHSLTQNTHTHTHILGLLFTLFIKRKTLGLLSTTVFTTGGSRTYAGR